MAKNYYEILWVGKNASADEIKRAYRKLAMKYHPDKTKWDKVAEKTFKEVNNAYETLSDTKKKAHYDQFGDAGNGGFGGGSSGSGYEDIFSQFSRQSGTGFWGQSRGNPNIEFDLGSLFGGAFWGGRAQEPQYDLDVEKTLELSIYDLLLGTKVEIKSTSGKTLVVTIPECSKPGMRLRLAGKWRAHGKEVGDMYLIVEAKMPSRLSEEARSILVTLRK